jgi:hypothetical protein
LLEQTNGLPKRLMTDAVARSQVLFAADERAGLG